MVSWGFDVLKDQGHTERRKVREVHRTEDEGGGGSHGGRCAVWTTQLPLTSLSRRWRVLGKALLSSECRTQLFFFFLLNSYRKLEKKTKKQTKAAILQPLPASPLAYWEHDLSLDRLQEIVQLSWYVPLPKSFSSCPDGLRRTTAVSHWQGFNPYCASQCNLNTWACVSGFWFICINHLKFPKTYQFKPFKTTYVH